jgi:TrpR family transcriptional regulator, trp operon repressor
MAELKELARVLAGIGDPGLIEGFLRNMLTRREIEEISRRWALVKLLNAGMSQRAVARKLDMSLCKITRGSKELKKRNSCLKRVLDEHLRGLDGPAHPTAGKTPSAKGAET